MNIIWTVLNISLLVGTIVLLIACQRLRIKTGKNMRGCETFLRETQEEVNQFWKDLDLAKGRGLPQSDPAPTEDLK